MGYATKKGDLLRRWREPVAICGMILHEPRKIAIMSNQRGAPRSPKIWFIADVPDVHHKIYPNKSDSQVPSDHRNPKAPCLAVVFRPDGDMRQNNATYGGVHS